MAHKLNILISDSAYNDKYLYVKDLSEWDSMLDIKHRILQVLSPDATHYLKIILPQNGDVAITSNMLGLGDLEDLADGFYHFHYSVSPNRDNFLEVGHLRISRLYNKLLGKLSSLSTLDKTAMDTHGNIEITRFEEGLLYISLLLQGAQAAAANQFGKQQALDLYNRADREFIRLTHKELH